MRLTTDVPQPSTEVNCTPHFANSTSYFNMFKCQWFVFRMDVCFWFVPQLRNSPEKLLILETTTNNTITL